MEQQTTCKSCKNQGQQVLPLREQKSGLPTVQNFRSVKTLLGFYNYQVFPVFIPVFCRDARDYPNLYERVTWEVKYVIHTQVLAQISHLTALQSILPTFLLIIHSRTQVHGMVPPTPPPPLILSGNFPADTCRHESSGSI